MLKKPEYMRALNIMKDPAQLAYLIQFTEQVKFQLFFFETGYRSSLLYFPKYFDILTLFSFFQDAIDPKNTDVPQLNLKLTYFKKLARYLGIWRWYVYFVGNNSKLLV